MLRSNFQEFEVHNLNVKFYNLCNMLRGMADISLEINRNHGMKIPRQNQLIASECFLVTNEFGDMQQFFCQIFSANVLDLLGPQTNSVQDIDRTF